jgi:hypothetical protein
MLFSIDAYARPLKRKRPDALLTTRSIKKSHMENMSVHGGVRIEMVSATIAHNTSWTSVLRQALIELVSFGLE